MVEPSAFLFAGGLGGNVESVTRIIINGSKGRMGQALLACAKDHPELQVVAGLDAGDDLASVLPQADAVIDFTHHDATAHVAALCATHGKALVIGTTGHSEAEKAAIRLAAAKIPMVWASNYSTGVNTLFWLTRKAAEILGPSFDLEVIETHHRLKRMHRVELRPPCWKFWETFAKFNWRKPCGTVAMASLERVLLPRSVFMRCAVAMWWAITRFSLRRSVSGWN